MGDRMSSFRARRKLATLWLVGAVIVFFLLILQSVSGVYSDRVEEAWSWFLPTVIPPLSLIMGVIVRDSRTAEAKGKSVDRFFFRLPLALSAVYLLIVAFSAVGHAFVPQQPLELMSLSNLWLGPLQGFVTASLGIFFINGEHSE